MCIRDRNQALPEKKKTMQSEGFELNMEEDDMFDADAIQLGEIELTDLQKAEDAEAAEKMRQETQRQQIMLNRFR